MIELKSQIVITDDFDNIKEFLCKKIKREFLYIIENSEFKIENAKEAIEKAYLTSEKEKFIVLIAEEFNIYSQNALLKILEESPKNINFIIVTKSKSALLPTIRSRLPIANIKRNITKEIEIEIKDIDLNYIYNYLQNQKEKIKEEGLEKSDARNLVEALFIKATKAGIEFNEDEIALFENSIKLIELNSNIINILTMLFLIILEAKKR